MHPPRLLLLLPVVPVVPVLVLPIVMLVLVPLVATFENGDAFAVGKAKLEHMVVQFECREVKAIEGGGDVSI